MRHLLRQPLFWIEMMLIILLGTFALREYQRNAPLRSELRRIEGDIHQLSEEQQRLTEKINSLGIEENLEKEIRAQFNLGRSGEKLIFFPQQTAAATTASNSNQPPQSSTPPSFWQRLKNLIF